MLGGLIGFLKAHSKVSLIMSAVFSALLALCALAILPLVTAQVLIGLLIIVFTMRLAKTKKFMPAGMMIILSAGALIALLVVK